MNERSKLHADHIRYFVLVVGCIYCDPEIDELKHRRSSDL